MDLLGSIAKEARDTPQADQLGLLKSKRRQEASVLLAGMPASLT